MSDFVVMVADSGAPYAGWYKLTIPWDDDFEPSRYDILEEVAISRADAISAARPGEGDGQAFDSGSWQTEVADSPKGYIGYVFCGDFEGNEWEYHVRYPNEEDNDV
jgi:hypothetical protein